MEGLRGGLRGTERYFVYGVIALVLYVYKPKGLYAIFFDLLAKVRAKVWGKKRGKKRARKHAPTA